MLWSPRRILRIGLDGLDDFPMALPVVRQAPGVPDDGDLTGVTVVGTLLSDARPRSSKVRYSTVQ